MLYSGVREEQSGQSRTIAIVGPTAVGKTAVGIELAGLLTDASETLSVDSVQIYRGLDIGSAKPSPAERAAVTFHLLDVADPDEDFTVADFQRLAEAARSRIFAEGKRALLVGGAGLYFRAITTRLDIPHTPPDPEFRAKWTAVAQADGAAAVRDRLLAIDPDAALGIHQNDVRRMIRAIEVYEKTGKPLSAWHKENRAAADNGHINRHLYCLDRNRLDLYEAIDRRVDQMIRDGLFDEVRTLRGLGYESSLKSMQSLGYKQVNAYLDGTLSREDAIARIKTETKQFARRQLIWFRADKRLEWIGIDGLTARQIALRISASVNN